MMQKKADITRETIDQLCILAQLELTEEEVENAVVDMKKALDYFSQIKNAVENKEECVQEESKTGACAADDKQTTSDKCAAGDKQTTSDECATGDKQTTSDKCTAGDKQTTSDKCAADDKQTTCNLREDIVQETACAQELLETNAPAWQNGMLVVPKTF